MRLLGGLVLLVAGVVGEQHILLDSTKESMLDWFKYPKGPQSPTPGQLGWGLSCVDVFMQFFYVLFFFMFSCFKYEKKLYLLTL